MAIERHDHHFEPDTPDEEWLPKVAARGWIAVSGDKRILRRSLATAAIHRSRATSFGCHSSAPSSLPMRRAGSCLHQARRPPNRCQVIEVRVRGLESGTVSKSARGNKNIGGRDGDSSLSGSGCQHVRPGPDLPVDRQLWQHTGEFPQHLAFTCPPGAVPEFQLNQWAPAGFPAPERPFDACTDLWVAVRSKEVDPGRSIDEDQWFSPFGESPESPPALPGRGSFRRTWRVPPCACAG